MAREDFERRRLRGMFERNKRRGDRIADLRDRRSGGDDEVRAPRRYIVSERRTRIEGFGRGGAQIRRVIRESVLPSRRMRFADHSIFRRGGRDRFRRDDDYDREMRRDRFREGRRRRGGIRGRAPEVIIVQEGRRGGGGQPIVVQGSGARFGGSRRLRMRVREERRRGIRGGNDNKSDNTNNNNNNNGNGGGRRRRGRRGGDSNQRNDGRRASSNNNGSNQQHQRKQLQQGRRGRRDPVPTREELDAQMDRFRGN